MKKNIDILREVVTMRVRAFLIEDSSTSNLAAYQMVKPHAPKTDGDDNGNPTGSRWVVFKRKMDGGEKFTLADGRAVVIPIKSSQSSANAELYDAVKKENPVAYKAAFKLGVEAFASDGKPVVIISPTELKKDDDFKTRKGSPWAAEGRQIAALDAAIKAAVVESGAPINIKMGGVTAKGVVGCRKGGSGAKADGVLVDENGESLAGLSLKYADAPSQMQQWGGVTKYRGVGPVGRFEAGLLAYKDVDSKADEPFVAPGEAYFMEIQDKSFAQESVWGPEGEVAAVIATKGTVSLKSAPRDGFEFKVESGEIWYDRAVPEDDWRPVLAAIKGDRNHLVRADGVSRSDAEVLMKVRVGVYPFGFLSGRKVTNIGTPRGRIAKSRKTPRFEAALREYVRMVMLCEGPSGPGVTADPTNSVGGFYPYEIERGADIHGYWYKSPGDKGSSDPMRPSDAAEYIGFKTKGTTPEDAAAAAEPPPEPTPE